MSELEKLYELYEELSRYPTARDIRDRDISIQTLLDTYGGVYQARVEAGIHPPLENLVLQSLEDHGPSKMREISNHIDVSPQFLQLPIENLRDDGEIEPWTKSQSPTTWVKS